VQLFRRLFNFEPAKVAQSEQRLNHRHTPGAAFPLHAALALAGRTTPAKVLNLSGNGLGLLIPQDTPAVMDQLAAVTLTLAEHRLELAAVVAHVRPQERSLYCGLGLKFPKFPQQKAYLQLIQPIAIGQSLRPVPAERVVQNEPQFIKQVYRGESDCVLTVWLQMTMGTPLHSFEFHLDDYFCRATLATGQLEAYQLKEAGTHAAKLTQPVHDDTGELSTEIRQLFRWIVPNLSAAVPDDVRASLQHFAATAR
jgi:hypothetical protein